MSKNPPALIVGTAAVTMTSREIAELVESRHDTVKVAIDRLAKRGVIGEPAVTEYLDTLGRAADEYQVCKRDSYVIVAQLSPEFTARLVDRWQELEAAVPVQLPMSRMDILKMAIDSEQRAVEAEAALALAAPKVEFVDRYVQAGGLKGFRETCKLLKANEARFREFVIANKIMYRLGSALTAHQNHIDAGRFEVRTGHAEANDHAFTSTKFTAKGIDWIAGEWGKYQLTQRGAE